MTGLPELRLVPSGGVTRTDAAEYVTFATVPAVSDSWLLQGAS